MNNEQVYRLREFILSKRFDTSIVTVEVKSGELRETLIT